MSNSLSAKLGNSSAKITVLLLLLVAVLLMGLLTAKKILVREPTVDPLQNEISVYTESLNNDPKNSSLRVNLAFAYQKAGQFDQAKKLYQEVLNTEAKNLVVLYNLGVISSKENKLNDAENYLVQVMGIKEDHVLGAVALGAVYLKLGKYDQVLQVVDKVIQSEPNIVDLHLIKGKALEMSADKAGAKREYETVLKFVRDHKEATDGLNRLN